MQPRTILRFCWKIELISQWVWWKLNPLTAEWALRALIDFTLSNARRFYASMGNPLDGKGLRHNGAFYTLFFLNLLLINLFAWWSRTFSFVDKTPVPPSFTIVPSGASEPSGSSPVYNCQATGDPVPVISWTKVGSSQPTTETLRNGSLWIKTIQKADEGRYRCLASNKVKTVTREITISVYSKFN